MHAAAADWNYLDAEGKERGPFPFARLKSLAESEVITADTFVWPKSCLTLESLKLAGELPELAASFSDLLDPINAAVVALLRDAVGLLKAAAAFFPWNSCSSEFRSDLAQRYIHACKSAAKIFAAACEIGDVPAGIVKTGEDRVREALEEVEEAAKRAFKKGNYKDADCLITLFIDQVARFDYPLELRGLIRQCMGKYDEACRDYYESFCVGPNGLWTEPSETPFTEIYDELLNAVSGGNGAGIETQLSALTIAEPENIIAVILHAHVVALQGGPGEQIAACLVTILDGDVGDYFLPHFFTDGLGDKKSLAILQSLAALRPADKFVRASISEIDGRIQGGEFGRSADAST